MTEAAIASLRELDLERLRFMIAADVDGLNRLLSDRLVWIHGSGHSQGKSAFLQSIKSASTRYRALDRNEAGVISAPGVAIFNGTIDIAVTIDHVERNLKNRFTNVWMDEGDVWRMVSWQSTPIRD